MKTENKDIILWNKAQKGDQRAFDELYRSHVQILYKYGIHLGANSELVKDCIQDLFVNLWKKRTSLNIEKAFKNYLLLSLRRMLLRKKEMLIAIDPNEISEQLIVFQKEIKENISNKSDKIKKALQFLPKRQREAIHLKYYQNLDYEEIAQTMSIQVAAVYKLVSVGIKKLRTLV